MTLLHVEEATLIRGGRLLFDKLEYSLGPGEAAHVTGPNGCGKSSLIRMIAGLLKPAAGRVERSAAALADEHLALDRELTLRRALGFWRLPHLDAAMVALDLGRLADLPVRLLSTGQAKRARLARVMASGAPLWLLDEPLNGLDRDGVEQLDRAIAAHRDTGGAVLAASHVLLGGKWRELKL